MQWKLLRDLTDEEMNSILNIVQEFCKDNNTISYKNSNSWVINLSTSKNCKKDVGFYLYYSKVLHKNYLKIPENLSISPLAKKIILWLSTHSENAVKIKK